MDKKNRTKAELSADAMGGQGLVSEIEIVRGELATLLYEQTSNDAEYIFGDSITAIENREEQVQVKFEKEAGCDYDLVILADGLGSRTREFVFKNSRSSIIPFGYYTSYFSIPYEKSDGTWSRCCNASGGRSILLRPDGRKTMTTRAFLGFRGVHQGLEKLSVEEQKAQLCKLFENAGWETPRILSGMDKSTDFYLQEIAQIKMNTWSNNRVALLGDAGYCPSPISGMGTSVAIVGAYILAGEIARHENHKDAFASYESLLRPYVTNAQKLPPGAPRIATPETDLGIWFSHKVLGVVSFIIRTGAARPFTRFFSPPAEAIKLPNYDK